MYKFIGTLKNSKLFAYPKPSLGQEYSEEEYDIIMQRNCNCLSKYFRKS